MQEVGAKSGAVLLEYWKRVSASITLKDQGHTDWIAWKGWSGSCRSGGIRCSSCGHPCRKTRLRNTIKAIFGRGSSFGAGFWSLPGVHWFHWPSTYFRRRSDIHKRLMLLGSSSIFLPALGRIPDLFSRGGLWGLVGFAEIVPLTFIVYDTVRSGRPHPAFAWGGLAIVLSWPTFLLVGSTSLGSGSRDG